MYYAGIDLHKKYTQISMTDETGTELVNQRVVCNQSKITKFFSQFSDQPISSVIEATANWPWLVRVLKSEGIGVCLAHPFRLKAIASARIKTDGIDAKTLADLLRAKLIPQSYLPSMQEQQDKDLVRFRINLVRQKTKLKNRIHAILTKQNVIPPKTTDLFGKKGRTWLKKLINNQAKEAKALTTQEKELVRQYLELVEKLETKVSLANTWIKGRLKTDPQAQRLLTVPGFGAVTAFLISAELGDLARFNSHKQLVGYVGLNPSVYSSGGKTRRGKLTKVGNPYIRWILVQAAYRAVKKDPHLKQFFSRVSYRRGKKKAIVAVARKLLVSCYFMIKKKQDYQYRREIRQD